MVLMETPLCDFGRKAIDFTLLGIDNQQWSLADCAGENGTLIMFLSNHCPYVKAIQERLVEDTLQLQNLGINSVAIMSNDAVEYPEDSFDNMKKIADSFNYPFPFLYDETQDVARSYDAICTPDFFGYNNSLELQYRGRLDASGMKPPTGETKRDLFEAMTEVAKTSLGPRKQFNSIGCSIKWKNND